MATKRPVPFYKVVIMADIFRVDENGYPRKLEKAPCLSEERELQQALERNHDLLPGDQINPQSPRRWLLVQREMPVPDPGAGGNRWSIDFFFLDQDATPTFVECKRGTDTRARREIVAQVLEYAANGAFYWDKSFLMESLRKTSMAHGSSPEKYICKVLQDDDADCEAFIDNAVYKLREGNVRLVFFLNEAPAELKSIVDFLNRQMERTEVLLVEAKQYRHGETKIVVPMLFGYTEEARRIKKENTLQRQTKEKRIWTKPLFLDTLRDNVGEDAFSRIRTLVEAAGSAGAVFKYGRGDTGSLGIVVPSVSHNPIILLWTDGNAQFQIGFARGTKQAEKAREGLVDIARSMNLHLQDDLDKAFPFAKKDVFLTRIDAVRSFLDFLLR